MFEYSGGQLGLRESTISSTTCWPGKNHPLIISWKHGEWFLKLSKTHIKVQYFRVFDLLLIQYTWFLCFLCVSEAVEKITIQWIALFTFRTNGGARCIRYSIRITRSPVLYAIKVIHLPKKTSNTFLLVTQPLLFPFINSLLNVKGLGLSEPDGWYTPSSYCDGTRRVRRVTTRKQLKIDIDVIGEVMETRLWRMWW